MIMKHVGGGAVCYGWLHSFCLAGVLLSQQPQKVIEVKHVLDVLLKVSGFTEGQKLKVIFVRVNLSSFFSFFRFSPPKYYQCNKLGVCTMTHLGDFNEMYLCMKRVRIHCVT